MKSFVCMSLLLFAFTKFAVSDNQFALSHCTADDGSTLNIGDVYKSKTYWYRCSNDKEGYFPYLKRSGCVSASGDLVSAAETFNGRNYAYQCRVSGDGMVQREPVACIDKTTGKSIAPGDTYVHGGYVYSCTLPGGKGTGQRMPVACLNPKGEQMRSGDSYTQTDGGYFFECKPNEQGMLQLQVAGCVDELENKVQVGGSFLRPDKDVYQYRNYCIKDPQGTIKIDVQSCKYTDRGNNVEIKTGCYVAVDNNDYFACKKWYKETGSVIISFTPYIEELSNLKTGPECMVNL